MSRSMARSERLREMERLYVDRSFSDIEMANRLGVYRTTVFRDRQELELEYPFIEEEYGRWKIDKTRYLSSIHVNIHEALALYLAARRASRQTRNSQPHVASALEKLAAALRQPMTERLVHSASEIYKQAAQPERIAILETITRAWVEGRKVRIQHRSLHDQRFSEYLVSPYLIEPSLLSDGAYLIGYSESHASIRTFKVERIERAELTSEKAIPPVDFDEREIFKFAWGIWYTDAEPALVKLRFGPGEAARRLKESIWHPTQEIFDTPDDGCIWQAKVAEWREIAPWVRGWGGDVEVLEPALLRENLRQETLKLVSIYLEGNTGHGSG